MAKTFLITTPEYDPTTDYVSKWSQEIVKTAENNGFNVINLKKEKANRKELESRLTKSNPTFVMFNGHGNQDEVHGHNDQALLKTDENDHILKDTVVYARSCDSLTRLGKSCSKKGTRAFVGYSMPFMFFADPGRTTNPTKDELAAPCFISSNVIPSSLLKGNNVREAVEKFRDQTNKLIALWKTKSDMEASFVIGCLMWNKLALGIEGDDNATV